MRLPPLVVDDSGRLLHGLNDRVEQHTIEARVLKADALLVVLDERVHGGPPYNRSWTTPIVGGPPYPYSAPVNPGISRGGVPCLVPRSVNSWPYAGGSVDEAGTTAAAECSHTSVILSPKSAAE